MEKINLYRNEIIKFINKQFEKNQINELLMNDNLQMDNSIIGILFLTIMNGYFKTENISIHGYYIASSLIMLFIDIKNKIFDNNYVITGKSIIFFFTCFQHNIDYLNSRLSNDNILKKKINNNLQIFMSKIYSLLNDIICLKKYVDELEYEHEYEHKHEREHNSKELNNGIYKIKLNSTCNCVSSNNIFCKSCIVNELLTKFFFILLMTSKFMGTGIIHDPNLYKLSEYYSNIFYIWINVKTKPICDKKFFIDSTFIFDSYMDCKNKLMYSIIELKHGSATIDEIINYLDNSIMNSIIINKI